MVGGTVSEAVWSESTTATTWGEAVGDAVGDAVDPNTEKGRRGVQGGRGHEQGATKVHNRTTGQQHNSNRRKLPNEARGTSLPCASLGRRRPTLESGGGKGRRRIVSVGGRGRHNVKGAAGREREAGDCGQNVGQNFAKFRKSK